MPTIENSLFNFDGWDGDHSIMVYYDCTLIRDIGEYKTGQNFSSISINNDDGIMEFYGEDDIINTFKLKYEIVE